MTPSLIDTYGLDLDFSAEHGPGDDDENDVVMVKNLMDTTKSFLQESNGEECEWVSGESFEGEVVPPKASQEKTCYISGKMVIVQKLHL